MTENDICTLALPYALRVARCMSRDPEVESIAGVACLKAVRTYNGKIELKRWIARVVRQYIHSYWRKRKVRARVWQCDPIAADDYCITELAVAVPDDCEAFQIGALDRLILTDYYVNKLPLDVVGKKYGMPLYRVRLFLTDAVARVRLAAEAEGMACGL